MSNVTETFNEQFKQVLDMQSKSIEPLRIFAGLATEAAEQIARQNYAVAGDWLEYSAKAANLPLSTDNVSDIASVQVAENTSFVELMNSRASEYADMAQTFSTKAREAVESASASYK
ncbi:MAG: phasin family protein [Granulosicoccus sp.]|nr:phasin family protein [Granulosicoccus sp.]